MSAWRAGAESSDEDADDKPGPSLAPRAPARERAHTVGLRVANGKTQRLVHRASSSDDSSSLFAGSEKDRSKKVSAWEHGRGGNSGLVEPWELNDDDEHVLPKLRLSPPKADTLSSSSDDDDNDDSTFKSLSANSPLKQPQRPALAKTFMRQDHIRHLDEEDIEYYTESDSDYSAQFLGKNSDSEDDDDDKDETSENSFSGGDEVDEDGVAVKSMKKKKKKKKRKNGVVLTPPMSPKSKTRYRCIKGELAAAKAKTTIIREKYQAVKYVFETENEQGEKTLSDELSAVVSNAARASSQTEADLRVRTTLFAKTNGLSALPVCTCDQSPSTLIGPKQVGSLASYCQIHMPFAAAKMGKYGTSHSQCDVEEATRRLRSVYLLEQAAEEKRKAKVHALQDERSKRGHYAWNRDEANAPRAGDSDDSDWEISNVVKTVGMSRGAPRVVPNPQIERAKQRMADLRDAHGYQLFETRINFILVTNNSSKSLYRVAKIERFSDEFRVEEDSHLYSKLQLENLLRMTSQTQGGCRRISEGRGIVGFIQLYNFQSASDSGWDLDAMTESGTKGDIIRITEQIYRRHVCAMKRKELMFSFLERTKAGAGVPSYLHQLGPRQGYTVFSGADAVRPIGAYGSTVQSRGIPTNANMNRAQSIQSSHNAVEKPSEDAGASRAQAPPKAAWYEGILSNIDKAVEKREQEEKAKLAKKLTEKQAEDLAERLRKQKEEEEEAARVAAAGDWTKLILEGFIVPEIPTNNALPGQMMQVDGASNKFIYRTKYLTTFDDLPPSDDESADDTIIAPSGLLISSDSSDDDEPAKGLRRKVMSFHETSLAIEREGKVQQDHEKKIIFKDEDATFASEISVEPSVGVPTTKETVPAPERVKSITKLITPELKHVGTIRIKTADESATLKTPSVPTTPKAKPNENPQKGNAVTINSKMYQEDYYESDTDPDEDYEFTESSSDTDEDVEFVEYTLIERILIFLGFLEDHQAKKVYDSSSDDETTGRGFFSRAYEGATNVVRAAMGDDVTDAAAVKKPLKKHNSRKVTGGDHYEKKDAHQNTKRKTKEELQAEIERRKLALEKRKARRAKRAEIRAARKKAHKKAQDRLARYKFDESQNIVKLRFKSFGAHAPLML